MEARVRALLPAIVAAWLLAACGGSNGNGGDNPNPNPGGGNTQNPCASASVEPGVEAPATAPSEAALRQKRGVVDHNPRWRVFDALWTHRQRIALGGERAAETTGRDSVDIGEIAVVQDEGDLIAPPNQFDVRNTGLRFSRNSSGGYNVSRIDGAFRATLGTRITLSDDDSRQVNVPFSFPILRPRPDDGVRQLRRQHYVRAGGSREHRPQRRAPADRTASGRPVPGRSRSQRRRTGVRQCCRGSVHRDVVRRSRL